VCTFTPESFANIKRYGECPKGRKEETNTMNKLFQVFRSAMIVVVFAGLVSVLAAAPTARADEITGQVWENTPDATNAADPANMAASLPSAMFTSTGIKYTSGPSPYTVMGFLNNPTFRSLANGFNRTASADNTEVQLTGSILLTAGSNAFGIGHDDGITLALSAGPGTVTCSTQSGTLCVDAYGQTTFQLTHFTATPPATGLYNFTLDYAECCGQPADLEWAFKSGVPVGTPIPEPSTVLTFATGLLGLGVYVKKLRFG
jgi:hypothetical protein